MKIRRSHLRAFSLIELSIVVLVIGLIVASIIGGTKLVKLSNLSKARALTNSSPVNGIEDLAFWVETTSKSSFPDGAAYDGNTISTWYDINPQSTYKKHLTRTGAPSSTVYAGPTYRDNLINGLPGLAFDNSGTEQIIASNDIIDSSTIMNSGQITIFMVGKYNGTKCSGCQTLFGLTGTTLRLALESLSADGSSGIRFFYGSSYIDGTKTIASNFILTGLKDSTTQYLYMNGVLDSSGAKANSASFSENYLTIGGYRPQPSPLSSNLYIGELIIFSRALSDFERQQVEQYLSKKWQIKLS